MKILFFSPYFYPYISGLTIYPYKILKHLCKYHSITILTFPYQKKGHKEKKLKIIYLPYLFKISKGYISPQSFFYFYYYLKKSDILFLNQPNFNGLFLAILAKIFNKKIISLFHCQVFLKPTFFNKIINFFLSSSMIIQFKLSNKIIIYKEYFQSLPYYSYLKEKIVTILPPIEELKIDKNFFQKIKKNKNKKIFIGFSGRISSEKGIEFLIEAVSQIKNKKITLLFAGPYGEMVAGEKDYFLRIQKLLRDKKIDHQFLGNLKNSQLGAFDKVIDVLVLPSVNSTEAFGMVQAEAMVLGTPVIASNLPGVNVPIKLTKMGILVEPKNVQQLREAILKVINNRQKFANKELASNAKKVFNIRRVYQFYEELFKNYEKA